MQEGLSSGVSCCQVNYVFLLPRREDDGTFVVLMQSVEHPDAPLREAPFYNWRAPIRAQVLVLYLPAVATGIPALLLFTLFVL